MFLFAYELKRRSGNIKHMYLTFNGIENMTTVIVFTIPVGVLKVH